MGKILIQMWYSAMRNPMLCAEALAHIEYILSVEYRTL